MITIIGLGFVGLTSALGFAEKGFKVYGVEKDERKYQMLINRKVPFHEPYLMKMLEKHINLGNFVIKSDLESIINESNILMICVGTPSSDEGRVDLSQVKSVIKELSRFKLNSFKVLCIKSTVPPSTINLEIIPYLEKLKINVFKDIGISHNPEFLREGKAWEDFINPDRIVIGCADEKSKKIMNELYKNFDSTIYNVNINTSEYIKYASNTMLASLISFSNELEMIAYSIGDIDIKSSFEILHKDKRWNGSPCSMSSYVYPGCGFGGYCLPKDLKALIFKSEENNHNPSFLKATMFVNSKIRHFLIEKITSELTKEDKICLLGLSFKPNSDDVRSTSSAWIIKDLIDKGFKNIIAYDPIAVKNFKNIYRFDIEYSTNIYEAIEQSSIIILATAWEEFKKLKNLKSSKRIFDLRFYL